MRGAGSAPARDRWRFVPMAGWIRSYERAWLKDDLIAGFAVAALIVPKNLGYAGIAGIPLQNGLYAAAAGAILYAVFGTSRQISTGPSSGLAAVPPAQSPGRASAGDARTSRSRHHYRIDNQESAAQGMANASAGLFQGMPVSTSLSASSLNDHTGARTGLASLTSGVTVLLTLVVLAPVFSKLPKPVLAALIIEAVVMGMMDVPEMRRLARVQRFDFWIAIAAIIATLLVGVLAGVLIGIGLSLIWLISVATRPPMPLLGREPGTQAFRELDEHPGDEQFPGIVVLRLDGGLFFATSDALEARVREVALSTPGITGIVLDCEGIDFIDSQGSAKMREILELTEQAGVILRLARVKPAVREVLERNGVLDRIGDDKTHGNVDQAVEAQIPAEGGTRAGA